MNKYLFRVFSCFKKYKHIHKLCHNAIDYKTDSEQKNKIINKPEALGGKIDKQDAHANGKERTEKIHALQVFKVGSLICVKGVFF